MPRGTEEEEEEEKEEEKVAVVAVEDWEEEGRAMGTQLCGPC